MLGIVLALGSAISWGLSDFLGGLQARRVALLHVMVVSEAAGTVVLGAVLLARGVAMPSVAHLLPAGAAGLAGTVGLALYYRGLAVGLMSIVAPVAALGVTVPVFAGILGGERPAVTQIAGIVAAVCGVVLASREPRSAAPSPGVATTTGAALAVTAAVTFGIWLIGMHASARYDAFWAAFASRLPPTLILLAIAAGRRAPGAPAGTRTAPAGARSVPGNARTNWAALGVVGILDVAANCFYTSASRHGLLSVISVLSCLNPLVTVALARRLLGERVARVQEIGVVAALTGVLLIAVG